jgi:hypothetical protein
LALEDLLAWPIDRIAHTVLLREAWQHRHNVSAYDAFYVAAARIYDASLLTVDGPLTRAPALGIVVQNIRCGWLRNPNTSVWLNVAPPSRDCRWTKCVVRAALSAVVVKISRMARATCGMVAIGETPFEGM